MEIWIERKPIAQLSTDTKPSLEEINVTAVASYDLIVCFHEYVRKFGEKEIKKYLKKKGEQMLDNEDYAKGWDDAMDQIKGRYLDKWGYFLIGLNLGALSVVLTMIFL